MDADRFDAVLRVLSTSPSRRDAVRILSALGLAGLLGLTEVEAKRKKKKKKKHKGGSSSPPVVPPSPPPPPVPPPFCAGKNTCTDADQAFCDVAPGGNCSCWVTTGGSNFCGQGAGLTILECGDACTQAGGKCVNGTLCGFTQGCSLPCPDPR